MAIRELLDGHCLSQMGRDAIARIRFSHDRDLIGRFLDQTIEFKRLLESGESFPANNYLDLRPELRKARPERAMLEVEEVAKLRGGLRTAERMLAFFQTPEGREYKELLQLSHGLIIDTAISKALEKLLDEVGNIKDTASPALAEIRHRMVREQVGLRGKMEGILRQLRSAGTVGDDVNLTVRGGRTVIPLPAEYKRQVKGFVHDVSATGQTVFMEPEAIFETNNLLRELEHEERRETVRLLMAFTDLVRPELSELLRVVNFMGIMDMVRAKALLAIDLSAERPQLLDTPQLDLKAARHPLLLLSHSRLGKQVIPLDIRLDPQWRMLLISGPNAGGKSVCLKTVGLLQYMLQCGLPIPVGAGSKAGIFLDIFIDIGDEQSLENDLSTYSSHLTNMRNFLQKGREQSLILIDEFGTGTEPELGGAIAEAILGELLQKGCFGLITTHYANLKFFAEKTPGIINGAMRYDVEHLRPLYELEMDKPGSSFAFEIAQNIGLPKRVVDRAKQIVGTEKVRFDTLLHDLEEQRLLYETKAREAREKDAQLQALTEKFEKRNSELHENRSIHIRKAKEEAAQLVKEANKRIEQTIREIRESGADKDKTRQLREELKDFGEKVAPILPVKRPPRPGPVMEKVEGPIDVGSLVQLKDSGTFGEVIAINGKDAEIAIGQLRSKVKLGRLQKVSKAAFREATGMEPGPSVRRAKGMDINRKMMDFSPSIDLRGKRGEEALAEVEQLIDNAILFSASDLRIIHGKGNGILKDLIRNLLKGYKEVKSVEDEHADRGGAGISIVKLN